MLEFILGGTLLGLVIGGAYGFEQALFGACTGFVLGALKGRGHEAARLRQESRFRSLENRLNALVRTLSVNQVPDESPREQPFFPVSDAVKSPPQKNESQASPPPRQDLPANSREESQFVHDVKKSLGGINVFARIGILLILIAASFLIKLAADNGLFPVEARLTGIAIVALALLTAGWKVRRNRPAYAVILEGGGVAILYLDVFAAFRLFDLLPGGAAFALLLGIVGFSTFIAVAQDAQALALMGTAGGFLAPLLTSTGGGSHVALFSYYALINAGVFGVALFKAWRPLNLIGFAFTFGIGSAWGARYFTPELFATTEPFLILFFIMYVGIAVSFALKQKADMKGFVDAALVFGVPLAAFGLQTAVVDGFDMGAGLSALACGFFYLGSARFLSMRYGKDLNRMTEAFLALGIGFSTLAIPLSLDERWTSAAWALEGAGLVWVSIRQSRLLGRLFGTILIAASGVAILTVGRIDGEIPVLNASCMGLVLVAASHLFAAAQFQRHPDRIKNPEFILGWFLLVMGVFWWNFAGLAEIDTHVPNAYEAMGSVASFATSVFAFEALSARWSWRQIAYPNFLLIVPAFLIAIQTREFGDAPFDHGGFAAWPLVLAAHYFFLKRHDADVVGRPVKLLHAAGVWLCTLLLTWQFSALTQAFLDSVEGFGSGWRHAAQFFVPGAVLLFVTEACHRVSWPFRKHAGTYLTYGAAPIAAFLALMVTFQSTQLVGDPSPLPYVPLFNPLELAQIFALAALLILNRERLRRGLDTGSITGWPSLKIVAFGAAAFMFLNVVLARSASYFGGVPFYFDALFASTILQTSYSILWSLLALTGMIHAHRRGRRGLWQVGAALLALVVAKLFMIDLSNTGSVARIVSFLGVGVLILIVGYFAPLPPKKV